MNLLRFIPHETLEQIRKLSNETDKSLLHHLEEMDVLEGLPSVFKEDPQISASFLPYRDTQQWRAALNELPTFPGGHHEEWPRVWTTGIPIGDFTVLIPDDASDAASVQLFTRIGNLWGRLILSGPTAQGKIRVQHATVDFTLHCPSVACGGNDAKCRSWCIDCKCMSIVLHGFDCSTCWCPIHGTQ